MSAIAADLTGSLAASGYGSDERRVSAAVVSGIVTLDGRVQRAGYVEAVCRLAWLVPGVVDVVPHLTVRCPNPPPVAPSVGLRQSRRTGEGRTAQA